jgi:hypothetical protein
VVFERPNPGVKFTAEEKKKILAVVRVLVS